MKAIAFPILIFLSFLFGPATCQGQDSSNYKFSQDIYDYIKKDSNYWRGGLTSSDLSFIGLYKEALIEYDKPRDNTDSISKDDIKSFTTRFHTVNARKFIIQKAKKDQIVIFNEAHFNPRNRVFLTSLLKDLKAAGYKYLAAETFSNTPAFTTSNHPTFYTGYYSMEPQFGNLIREAVRLNFSLYPYEDTLGGNGKEREIREAKNIQALLIKNPKAKIIVYCGFGHVREDSVPGWGKAMAGRLKEFTGIDPYTIDQTILSERSRVDLESPYYNLIHFPEYAVSTDKNGKAFYNKKEDAMVYSPRTKYIYARPSWTFENNKKAYFLNPKEVSISYPIIVEAYLDTDEIGKSIPIDVIEVKGTDAISQTAIALFSNGRFKIRLVNKDGKSQIIRVNNNRS